MKYCWLETDLEPEGILALYFLIEKQCYPSHIVLIKGNIIFKTLRLKGYLESLKDIYPYEPIILSEKSSEYEKLLTQFNSTENPLFISLKKSIRKYSHVNNIKGYFTKSYPIESKFKEIHFKETQYESLHLYPETWQLLTSSDNPFFQHILNLILLRNRYKIIKYEKRLTEFLREKFNPDISLDKYVLSQKIVPKFTKYYEMYKLLIQYEDSLVKMNILLLAII